MFFQREMTSEIILELLQKVQSPSFSLCNVDESEENDDDTNRNLPIRIESKSPEKSKNRPKDAVDDANSSSECSNDYSDSFDCAM